MNTFINELEEWTEIDAAEHLLGVHLGMVKEDSYLVNKWMYFTNNPYINALHSMILKMVEIDFLEYDEEKSAVRANPNFKIVKT